MNTGHKHVCVGTVVPTHMCMCPVTEYYLSIER